MVLVSYLKIYHHLSLSILTILLCSAHLTTTANGKPITRKKAIGDQFLDLGIEELIQIEITSASKHSQKRSEIPAAVFVITQEDIRRSRVTSIPETLHMAPSVEAAHIGTDKYHREFISSFLPALPTFVSRGVHAGMEWRF